MDSDLRKRVRNRRRIALPVIAGIVLFALGLAAQTGAGLGYGLLLVSVIVLGAGLLLLALLAFTRKYATKSVAGVMKWLFLLGGWFYVFGVCALAGFFVRETIEGRMAVQWILFGPAAIIALIVFDLGVYKLLYQRNRPAWGRYRQVIRPENADPQSMSKTFFTEVLMHTSLMSVSGFRWLRHTLMFWGFVLMFALEVVAVFVREAWPAFGFTDIWEVPGHPVRLAFDFAFDLFGLMVLVGCILALIWRFSVNQLPEKKFADTPSAIFLLLVVVSGFVVEGLRISAVGDVPGVGYSFMGIVFSWLMPASAGSASLAYDVLWYVHVFGSLAFIAYIPVHRLIHSCATPMGRMMNSQKRMLAEKRMNSLSGLAGSKFRSSQQEEVSSTP